YQSGGPIMDMIIPTNGALLAMLLAAGVPYGRWLRFAIPGALCLSLLGVVAMTLAG
ncbi:MAG: YfcC family protein, partial [Candidatus Latescibacteria bacterium]|nr:YfcC family protein [Candidatus Latescibacterota bacterium]